MTRLLRMTAGLTLWAAAFCLLYAVHGIGCANGWAAVPVAGMSLHRVVLIALWGATLAASVALAVVVRRGDAMLDRIAFVLALVGIAAIVVTGLPIVTLPACI